MKQFILALALICLIPLHAAHAATRDEQRAEIQKMRTTVLEKLYKAHPASKTEIPKAAGYAVFSSADVAAIFISGSYGRGLAHDNAGGKDTYMQMASLGAGLGAGVKDFRAVFVFDNQDAYDNFVKNGLDLSAHADVSVKASDKGAAVTGAVDVLPGVRVYQLTESGLLAQAMLKGTKFWADKELNEVDRSSQADERKPYNR
jgi:lipid-binding SYLF domain-containing protein